MSTGTKIFKGPSSIQIPRLTADPSGTPVNGEIYYNTTSNKFRQYVNAAWANVVDETSIASFAVNTDLSNLTNPTALNQDLLGSADNVRSVGASATRMANVFSAIVTPNALRVKDSGSAFYSSFVAPSMGANVSYTLPATDGTTGQQLTTNGSGVLSWSASGSGANVTLSNLTTTAINAALLSAADNTLALGASANRWSNVFSAIATPNDLRIKDSGSVFYNSFVSPSMGANVSYTLPSADGTSGQVLSTSGAGVLSWASAGSGANVTLSNLTSPTAINQDLIFNVAAPFIQTKDQSAAATNSQPLVVASGNSDDGSTGDIFLNSGVVTAGAGNSGIIYVESGVTQGTGATGNLFVRSAAPDATGGVSGSVAVNSGTVPTGNSSASGSLDFHTGGTDGGASGSIVLYSGDSAAGASGPITIYSGVSTSGASASGAMTINSGNVDTGASGAVALYSGNATGTTGTSGAVTITTGTTVDGNGGAVNISTGAPSGNANSGDISLTTGNAPSASSGNINISVGQTISTGYGNVIVTGNAVQNLNPNNGYVQVAASLGLSNGQSTLFLARLTEKTLAASTGSATLITGYTWSDNVWSSAKFQYQMTEVSTGKIRRGTLYLVQDYNTAADIVYNDTVEVENASFPNVVLSAVSTGGNVEIRFTNASTNNVYFNALTQLEPNAVGTV